MPQQPPNSETNIEAGLPISKPDVARDTTISPQLTACIQRIDLWNTSDLKQISPDLCDRLEQVSAQNHASANSANLSNWSITVSLDNKMLSKGLNDDTDFVQQIQEAFPGLLSILKFPSLGSHTYDVLQLRRSIPYNTNSDKTINCFLRDLAGSMEFDGIRAYAVQPTQGKAGLWRT